MGTQLKLSSKTARKLSFGNTNELVQFLKSIGIYVNEESERDSQIAMLETSIHEIIHRAGKLSEDERKRFLHKLRGFCEKTGRLKILLQPTKMKGQNMISDSFDSVLCILFQVEILQSEVGILLLEQMQAYQDNKEIRELLHRQLRMPENIVRDEQFFATLMKCIHELKGPIQTAVIECVPELVIGVEQHAKCAQHILVEMERSKNTVKAGLSALSVLDIKGAKNLPQIRTGVCSRLAQYMDEDLPAAVQFLLKTCDAESIAQVVNQLRSDDFNLFWRLSRGSSKLHMENRFDVAVVSEFRRFFLRNTDVVLAQSLKAISKITTELNVFDVLFLLNGCYVIEMDQFGPAGREKFSKLLFKKIPDYVQNVKASQATDVLLEKTLASTQLFLYRKFYDFLITIAGQMLRSGHGNRQIFGAKILQHLFLAFDREDERCKVEHMTVRRKSLEELLNAVTSTDPGCTQAVRDSVMSIMEKNPTQIAVFSVLFQNVLDNQFKLVRLPLTAIRQIFNMLMAFSNECGKIEASLALPIQKGLLIPVQLQIFVNKCLISIHNSTKCKSVGLLGSMALLRNAHPDLCNGSESTTIQNWKKNVSEQRLQCSLMNALYLEEVTTLIVSYDLKTPLLDRFVGNGESVETFERTYLTAVEKVDRKFGPELLLQLPKAKMVIDFPHLVFTEDRREQGKILGLLPHLELLQCLHNDVRKIDMLAVNVVVCDLDSIELVKSSDNQQFVQKICNVLYHSTNWMRQVLSWACEQKREEKCNLLLHFLDALVVNEKNLLHCLHYAQKWEVPSIWCLAQQPSICISGCYAEKPVSHIRKAKKNIAVHKTRNGNKCEEREEQDQQHPSSGEEYYQTVIHKRDPKNFAATSITRFLKEISCNVHYLLKYHREMNRRGILYLLRDLNLKLSHLLPKRTSQGLKETKCLPLVNSVVMQKCFSLVSTLKTSSSEKFYSVIHITAKAVVELLHVQRHVAVQIECLQFLTLLFTSEDLHVDKVSMQQLLRVIDHQSNDGLDTDDLIGQWLTMLLHNEEDSSGDISCLRLGAAYVELLRVFSDMLTGDRDASQEKIGTVCLKYILRSWEPEEIEGNRKQLMCLIQSHIQLAKDSLSSALTLADKVIGVSDVGKLKKSEYESFCPGTVTIYLNVLMDQLNLEAKLTRCSPFEDIEMCKRWCILVKLARTIISVCLVKTNDGNQEIMKSVRSAQTIRMLVRYSFTFLKCFLQHKMGINRNALDVFVDVLKNNTDPAVVTHAVAGILTVQRMCRNLHVLQTHIKKTKLQVSKLAHVSEKITDLNNRVEKALTEDFVVRNVRVRERNLEGEWSKGLVPSFENGKEDSRMDVPVSVASGEGGQEQSLTVPDEIHLEEQKAPNTESNNEDIFVDHIAVNID